MKLTDQHNRHIHKLRVSLTDACNMRCFYCMPDNTNFASAQEKLTGNEIVSISKSMSELTIDEIRLTGGEPLLHSDIEEIVKGVGALPLKKFGITTNALHLKKYLPLLKESNCRFINISLDSLRRDRYSEITGVDALPKVLDAITIAKTVGMKVKINTVIMKGINDDEIEDFVVYAATAGVEVRFLEVMKIGAILERFEELFISAKDIISKIRLLGFSLKETPMPLDSTSFNYRMTRDEMVANIGFIASESTHFCTNCSRLRLSSKGALRPCLMTPTGVDLKSLSKEEYKKAIESILPKKPLTRLEKLTQPMHQIGG